MACQDNKKNTAQLLHGQSGCLKCLVHDYAVCGDLSNTVLGDLEKFVLHKNVKAGDVIFNEGDQRQFVFTLIEGAVRLFKALPDGRRFITGFILPGDFIGLIDDDVHILSAEAIIDTRLCILHKQELDAFMEHNMAMRQRIDKLRRLVLKRSFENQLLLGRLTPIEKIARFILDLEERAVQRDMSVKIICLVMNRTDIADHLGLTIETVSRSFSKLKTAGIICLPSPNMVEILDHRRLRKIAALENNN